MAAKPAKIFVSYAHENEVECNELRRHLGVLKHEGIIDVWSDHRLSPGEPWDDRIRGALAAADIVLLLVSKAFLDSEFCYRTEMRQAMERHEAGIALVIPIVIEDCYWSPAPFGALQGLPRDMKPVKTLPKGQRDSVWHEVAKGIHQAVEQCLSRRPVSDGNSTESLGRDIAAEVQQYLPLRARHFRHFLRRLSDRNDIVVGDREHVASLRSKLLLGVQLTEPKLLTVEGTLFPCALLNSGWWERQTQNVAPFTGWRNRLQEWLFNGFDLWAPSWDFTWTLEDGLPDGIGPRFIAQIGSGDEADSLPVIIPENKADRLREWFDEGWGGAEVEVTGLLGHRTHFCPKCVDLIAFGGMLDYCLWLDGDDPRHKIKRCRSRTTLYSGYLWKCVVPRAWVQQNGRVMLEDAYFVWEHTNFAADEAVKYGLDALEHKEDYMRAIHGDLVLVQKSSRLVPGRPLFTARQAYDLVTGGAGDEI
ncbi:MAG: toll/interleukin-1 receptor domain-containing protein [Rhodospirillales bacterium]|nr:toll/interleukin-1 receptor domain-containing protein [Rhodospirillales bacterium]